MPAAGGAQEWGDLQRAHGAVRQLDERAPERSHLHLQGTSTGSCCSCCGSTAHELALQEGDRFWRMPETYIRGNTIKYVRVPNEVCLQPSAEFVPA